MTTLLALDTATDACSVALLHDGRTLERYEIAPRRHTRLILPMIEKLLADAGLACSALDAVAFGAGPGTFTGVRIATAVAQGLALARDVPVIPVSCLALLAIGGARAHEGDTFVPVMDARKHEIYAAAYTVDRSTLLASAIVEDWIGPAHELQVTATSTTVVVGNGATAYRDVIAAQLPGDARIYTEPAYPRARDALAIGATALAAGAAVGAEHAQPVYLRRAV